MWAKCHNLEEMLSQQEEKLIEEDGVKVCRRIEARKSFSARECCLDSWIQERIKISTGGGGQKRDGER